MKKLIFLIVFLLSFASTGHSASMTFEILSNIALEGKLEKSAFYLNSKNCSDKSNLHVAYHQKDNILIFGYFDPETGIIKNFLWNKKKGETSILSTRIDEVADPKKAVKITEFEMEEAGSKFRTDWLLCK